jgi:signal transduction histidine kinase
MNRLIGDLLDATRLQAGRLRLDIRDVDVRSLLNDAVEASRPGAQEPDGPGSARYGGERDDRLLDCQVPAVIVGS